jgi:hypothetical protein
MMYFISFEEESCMKLCGVYTQSLTPKEILKEERGSPSPILKFLSNMFDSQGTCSSCSPGWHGVDGVDDAIRELEEIEHSDIVL